MLRLPLLIALALTFTVHSQLTIHFGGQSVTSFAQQSPLLGNPTWLNYTGILEVRAINHTAKDSLQFDPAGKAIIYIINWERPNSTFLWDMSQKGAALVVTLFENSSRESSGFSTGTIGRDSYWMDNITRYYEITTPLVQMVPDTRDDYNLIADALRLLRENESSISITLEYQHVEMNWWWVVAHSNGLLAFQWINEIFMVTTILLASYRLYGFIYDYGVEVIGNGIDPFFSRMVLGLGANNFFQTAYEPFVLTVAVLIILYWSELVSDTVVTSKFLTTLKIPAAIAISLLFAVEIVSQALRIASPTTSLSTIGFIISIVIYILISVAVSIGYFVTGSLLWRRLAQIGSLDTRYKLRKVVALTTIIGVGTLLLVTVIILMATPIFFRYPEAYYCISFSCLTITTFLSFAHVYSFEPPSQKRSVASGSEVTVAMKSLQHKTKSGGSKSNGSDPGLPSQ